MCETAHCAQDIDGEGAETAEANLQKAIVKLWEGLCVIDDGRARTFVALAISRLSQLAGQTGEEGRRRAG